jgi:pilus assembly protein Flp/PilA
VQALKNKLTSKENSMTKFVKSFAANESGATAIEYALIAGLITVVAIVALQGVGTGVNRVFTNVNKQLSTVK